MFVKAEDPHDSFPKLAGRASEIKNFVPALAAVWSERMEADNVAHQAVLFGLCNSAVMDDILDRYPHVDKLPEDEAQHYTTAAWNYARAQQACAEHFNKEHGGSLMIFDITCKTHWLMHGPEDAKFLNPRLSWNYSGESFMGNAKTLLASCCAGNTASQSTNKFAEKYGHAILKILQSQVNGMTMFCCKLQPVVH